MKPRDIIKRSGRNLRQAKARTILTASAIAVGTFALTLTLAASNGAQHFVDNIIKNNFDPSELIVANDKTVFGRADSETPREYDSSFGQGLSSANAAIQFKQLSDSDIVKISAEPYTENLRKGITINLTYLTRAGQKKYVGVASTFNPAQHPDLSSGRIPSNLGGNDILLPEAYVEALGFKDAKDAIGKSITLTVRKSFDATDIQTALAQGLSAESIKSLGQTSVTEVPFTVAAVIKKPTTAQPGTELYMFISADAASRLNDIATKGTANYHKYNFVYVKVKNGNNSSDLIAAQDKLKAMGYTAQSTADTQKFLTDIIKVLQGIVAAFGAIAVIASVFGIVNTMYISVIQRTREIGLMKALGMRAKDVGRLFRFEAAWIGFLGGIMGSVIAFGVGTALNPWITTKLSLGAGNSLLIFQVKQIAVLIAILMIVAVLAGFFPARKASKLDPIQALRTE